MRNYLVIIFLVYVSVLKAQDFNQDYIVEHISVKEGLFHNYVSKIVSDSLNIKWIATENGVNKFDGLKFSVIEPNERYSELKNENIETLFIDSNNNLWIGTKSGGLSKLNIESNILTNYNQILNTNNRETLRIREISEDKNGNIWVGSHENGLYIINDQKKKVIKHFNNLRVKNISPDKDGNIWIAAQNTLNEYNLSYDLVFSISLERTYSKIALDESRNRVWISTLNENRTGSLELSYLDMQSKKITQVPTNIKANYASALFVDRDNKLWVGTWGVGLYQSNADASNFQRISLLDSYEKNTANYDIILDIHLDTNNIVWVSANYGGIVKLTKSKGFFNLDRILKRPDNEDNLNIHAIYKDSDGLYVGTLKNGLWFGKDISHLKQIFTAEDGKIHAIYKHQNFIVIGTGLKTVFLDKNRKEVGRLNISKSNCFLSESENILWIGTQKNGLYQLDVSNIKSPKILIHYSTLDDKYKIENNRITTLTYDAFGNMWMGSYNGLHLYDKATKSFIHYSKILKNHIPSIINTIHTDAQYIWVGTSNGLYKLNYTNKTLKIVDIFTVEDGLSNDFICGIVSDSQNNLWITSTTNLVKFDQFINSFTNYGKDDGVFTSFFNLRSIHTSDNNTKIFVGGIENLTYFEPEKIKVYEMPKKLLFTHLKIDNKIIQAHDSVNGKYFLDKDFNYIKNLEFTHKEKSFSIGFINNDFTNIATTNYRYKLVGYEDNWNYIKNQNEVNFIGLPPGTYELLVSSSKDFINWTNSNSLKIKINYPPFSSPLALFIYALITIALISVFFKIYFKQKYLRTKLKLSELAKEKEQDLNEAKLTFFTNISHEFRTPLTLILGPIRELISAKESQPESTEKLLIVEKNANRLLNLTNQLLDFRKAEHGLLKLASSNGNFVKFSNEVFMYFKEQANSKNITFNFKSNLSSIDFPFDRNKMEIVICNLISNALNHTNEGGKIELKIKVANNYCILSVTDTGIGIDQVHIDKIFDRFYQIKNTKTAQVIGSGIGLSFAKKIIELHNGTIEVESKIKKGTKFIVKLPLPDNQINYNEKKNQLINSENIDNYIKINVENKSLNPNDENSGNTILIVDDNEDIRQYLRSLLQNEYNIIEAADGEEGVALASDKMPDLILCDIMMPKKDGLTACKELKSQISTSHIPIIMLTARSSNMYEIEGLKTGADDFISKPFDPQVVKARIFSALQNRLKLREHFLNLVRFEPTTQKDEILDPETIFLNKVITLVEENLLDDTFGIETLMNELFMSQSTLYRKIKSLTGLSLTVFIRSIRLKKSAEIILTEDLKLSHVAMKVGFNDYKYFRESFVKQFGCLPSEYRNSFNNV